MAYATLAEMLSRHNRAENPELTQITAPAGALAPDDARVRQALEEASGQMDLYIGTRHGLPLSGLRATEATDLSRMCCDIARYRLWDDRASEEVRKRYEDAVRFLEQVSAGRIRLGAGTDGTSARAKTSITSQPRRFTRDTMRGIY